jgi:hypothetical protein
MAVVEKDKNTQILYKVQTGTSAGDNSPTYSTRTLSNITPNITTQDALELGQAVGSLQKFPLGSVYLRNTIEISASAE